MIRKSRLSNIFHNIPGKIIFQKKEFMDCLDPSVIKKRKLTQSDYKVSHIGVPCHPDVGDKKHC